VSPWTGLQLDHARLTKHHASFRVAPIHYPRLPTHVPPQLPFYADDNGGTGKAGASVICHTCTFRPWASTSHAVSAMIEIVQHGHVVRRVPATYSSTTDRWSAALQLTKGEHAVVRTGGVRDAYGETNGRSLRFTE
jgi:hypothetical protein